MAQSDSKDIDFISSNMDSELSFILADSQVDLALQCKLAELDYTSLKKMALLADTRAEMRTI
eukprot:3214807-Amphidinium_carterae.1